MNYSLNFEIEEILNDKNVQFIKAEISDLDEIISLFEERTKWFKENQIKQWSKYLEHHPKEEFEDIITSGYYFVLKENGNIIAGFELSTDSKYWNDKTTNAYYIYKLVTKVNYKNIGNLVFMICKNIAKNNNQRYLRLDCLKNNVKLNNIYEKHGFILKDTGCQDYYTYSLRECDLNEL